MKGQSQPMLMLILGLMVMAVVAVAVLMIFGGKISLFEGDVDKNRAWALGCHKIAFGRSVDDCDDLEKIDNSNDLKQKLKEVPIPQYEGKHYWAACVARAGSEDAITPERCLENCCGEVGGSTGGSSSTTTSSTTSTTNSITCTTPGGTAVSGWTYHCDPNDQNVYECTSSGWDFSVSCLQYDRQGCQDNNPHDPNNVYSPERLCIGDPLTVCTDDSDHCISTTNSGSCSGILDPDMSGCGPEEVCCQE